MLFDMKKNNVKHTLGTILVVVVGCTGPFFYGCSNRVPYDTVCMKNETGALIRGAEVLFGTNSIGGGSMMPGALKFYHGVPVGVPEKARVVWKSEDGQQHEKQVEVLRLMPSRMNEITIFFVINKDGSVFVKPLTEKEMEQHKYPYGDN
jgi:hypothetical protein